MAFIIGRKLGLAKPASGSNAVRQPPDRIQSDRLPGDSSLPQLSRTALPSFTIGASFVRVPAPLMVGTVGHDLFDVKVTARLDHCGGERRLERLFSFGIDDAGPGR